MDSSKPMAIGERALSKVKSFKAESALINCSANDNLLACTEVQKLSASSKDMAPLASTEITSPSSKSESSSTRCKSSFNGKEPILIFQCLNPASRNDLASAISFSGDPPSIRNKGISVSSNGLAPVFKERRYFHKEMERFCVYKSSNAISRQDFADGLPYKMASQDLQKRLGSLHSMRRALSTKYFRLANKLSRLSPVIRGATDASPQPWRPSSSVRQSSTVLASTITSLAIFIGSMSGIDRGKIVA